MTALSGARRKFMFPIGGFDKLCSREKWARKVKKNMADDEASAMFLQAAAGSQSEAEKDQSLAIASTRPCSVCKETLGKDSFSK